MLRKRLFVPCLLAVASLPGAALAQDPVPAYPENYRVLVENDRVRVLDFRLAKGAREDAHSHPAHVVYVLSGFRIRFTLPDGQTRIREARAGEVLFSEAITHASENIGDGEAHGILVELKTPGIVGAAAPGDAAARITALTWIRGLAGREDDLRQHLLSLAAPTRAEPGCFAYDLYQSPDRPQDFMRYEVWSSLDALETHKRTPHIRASFEKRQREGWSTEITVWRRVPE